MILAKPLFNAQTTLAAENAIYTAPANTRTIIDKFSGNNGTGTAATLAVKLIQSGGVAGVGNLIVTKSLAPGEAYTFPEVVGHVLNPGDFISVLQGTASAITIRASGREVT